MSKCLKSKPIQITPKWWTLTAVRLHREVGEAAPQPGISHLAGSDKKKSQHKYLNKSGGDIGSIF